ncbi:MAG: CRISPR-associated endonuclease Cas2 [Gammaproteobacteria bacterium]|nr:MAG: CRISPR-associated endonuclease Cas2 [Gammaproteobacteria bacterium]
MKRKPTIIAYDITDNKRRRQLFRCLKKWKLDAQYSVFECMLTDAEAKELFLQLTNLMETKEDSLLLTRLDPQREAEALTQYTKISFTVPVLYER